MSHLPADNPQGANKCWRVCREFRSREWVDGAVLYDTASGDTHHLSPAAFQILSLIRHAPRTQEELMRCMLSSDEMTVDDESLALFDATLDHLAELGLIESIQH